MMFRYGLIGCLLLSSCTLFQPAPVPRPAASSEQASDVGAAPNHLSAGGSASVPPGGAGDGVLTPSSDAPAGPTGTAKLIVNL